jgi:nondiscriminating aspartyl-tRNA synthetase
MRRTLSAALSEEVGQRATVQGWVHRRRRLSAVSFLIVRDRSGLAQVVVGDEAGREQLDGLTEETVISVDGMVTANGKAPGGVELTDPHITNLSARAATPPVRCGGLPSTPACPRCWTTRRCSGVIAPSKPSGD